jgi:hypothetical protein
MCSCGLPPGELILKSNRIGLEALNPAQALSELASVTKDVMDNEQNFSPEPDFPAPPQPSGDAPALPGAPAQQPGGQRNNGRRGGRGFRRRRRGGQGGGGQQQQNRGNGQSQNQQGGGQRRNRGQALTGPMDHSYRQGENGNGGGQPRNNGQGQNRNNGQGGRGRFRRFGRAGGGGGQQQRGNGNFQPQQRPSNFAYTEMEPLQISADAPLRIYVFVDDLFFTSKIQETAKKLGVKIGFVKTIEELSAKIDENGGEAPALIIFDLNGNTTKPLLTIPKLKAKFKKQTSILGFVSHLQGELKVKASEVGCDTVMPRSAFSQNLPNLLRRYAENEAELDERQPENL